MSDGSCLDADPRLAALRTSLAETMGPACRVLGARKLASRVYRISLTTADRSLSLIAKLLARPVAERVQLAIERWLPGAGLTHAAPALIGAADDPGGGGVWHLYEDLGRRTLADPVATRDAFERAVRLVATIHTRFAQDSPLAEWRVRGEDHGIAFHESSVRDAITAVEAVSGHCNTPAVAAGVERLRTRLESIRNHHEEIVQALAELGGPVTLLHGDLFPKNAAVSANGSTPNVRLLDWDKVGPGSFSYDLSTLALRAPARHRADVLSLYRQTAAANGLPLPADPELRLLFANAECARLASMATWIAREASERQSRWAFEQLVELDGWLRRVQERCSDWS